MGTVIHLLANAHLDPVWFWDWREGLNEGVKTCRAMATLLDEFPMLTFNRGEASIYAHLEKADPELFERIRAFHHAGRWDLVGGNIVQTDQNMPETATFIRQFACGKRYFKEKFGCDVKVAWAADSFGHSAGLPELYAAAGFEFFCFSRPPRELLELPDDLFYWEGDGGSRILATRLGIGWYGTERRETPARLDAVLAEAAGHRTRHIAVGFGLGDHGGGVSRRQIADALAWAERHPETEVRFSTFSQYFAAIREEEQQGLEIPVFRGELNFCLRGCYSSAAGFKHQFRRAERLVRTASRVDTTIHAALNRPAAEFDREWYGILFNTFHDILPGTCVERVYAEERDWLGSSIHSAAWRPFYVLNALASEIHIAVPPVEGDRPEATPFLVFNPNPVPYRGAVELEACLDFRPLWEETPGTPITEVRDGDGNPLPFQQIRCEHRYLPNLVWRSRVLCPLELPAFGWRIVTVGYAPHPEYAPEVPGIPATSPAADTIANGRFELRARPGCDRVEISRDGVPFPDAGGLSFALYGDRWGSWGGMDTEEDGVHFQHLREEWRITRSKVLESGPERSLLWVEFAGKQSRLELTLALQRNSDRIEGGVRLLWLDRSARLKLRLPQGNSVLCDVPGGEVRRSGENGVMPIVRYAAVETADGGYGFAADGGYGYENEAGFFALTVARSPRFATNIVTGPEEAPEDPVERGELCLSFRIAPGADSAPALADELEFPPVTLLVWPHDGKLPAGGSLLSIEPHYVTLLDQRRENGRLQLPLQNRFETETVAQIAFNGSRRDFNLPPWKIVTVDFN